LRLGQTTLPTSRHESRPKAASCLPASAVKNVATAATISTASATQRTQAVGLDRVEGHHRADGQQHGHGQLGLVRSG
jgi:hypothetical protein